MLVEDAFIVAGYCHCSECQKFSGSSFAAWGRIEREKVVFEKGRDLIRHYHKNETGRVAFCRSCGSCLYNGQEGGQFINIRLGILDDDPSERPSIHVYYASRARWYEAVDSLPKFDTVPGDR
jgi:hypothetical protein